MKIAVLVRGIAYLENYVHHSGNIMNIDYKVNLENLLKFIENKDVYLSTQSSKYNDDILKDLKPKKHVFLSQKASQNESLHSGLKLIEESYDFVIVTRLDIHVLTEIKPDYDKFNFLWYEQTKDHQVGDCLFLFHYRYLKPFIKALEDCPIKKNMHHIKPYLKIRDDEIHFLLEGYHESNTDIKENPIYEIKRGTIYRSFWNKYLKNHKLKLLGIK